MLNSTRIVQDSETGMPACPFGTSTFRPFVKYQLLADSKIARLRLELFGSIAYMIYELEISKSAPVD